MVDLADVSWSFCLSETGKRTSFMVPVMSNVVDLVFEGRSEKGCTVNAVYSDGQFAFLGGGNVVRVAERLQGVTALEIVTSGHVAYRCLLGAVVRDEVVDPTPAVVHEEIGEDDHIAFAVRVEVERYLRALGERGVLKEEIDVEDLVEDYMHGDHEFDEDDEDDGFVSRSYEDLAEERPSSSVSGNAGGQGAGEGPLSSSQPESAVSGADRKTGMADRESGDTT